MTTADTLRARADTSIGRLLGYSSSTLQEAADTYHRAGKQLQLSNPSEAIRAFVAEAECLQTLGRSPVHAYRLAAQTATHTGTADAVRFFELALTHSLPTDTETARLHETLAELVPTQAIQHYDAATEIYLLKDAPASAIKALRNAGRIATDVNRLLKCATLALAGPLTKFSVKSILLDAVLASSGPRASADTPLALDSSFMESREGHLAVQLVAAIQAHDRGIFIAAVKQFTDVAVLDEWQTRRIAELQAAL